MKAMTYDEAHDHYAEVLDSVVDDYEEVQLEIGRASCRERV